MKVLYSKELSKRLLIAFLFFVIILTLAALVVRYTVSQKLKVVVSEVNKIENEESKPEQILQLVRQVENEFQESFLSAGNSQNTAYKTKLLQAFTKIDSVLSISIDSTQPYIAQYVNVRSWYTKKMALSGRLGILRGSIDSFLNVYSVFKEEVVSNASKGIVLIQPVHDAVQTADTIRKVVPAKKKKLMGRIKDAILNKGDRVSETYVQVYQKSSTDSVILFNQYPIRNKEEWYRNTMMQLQQHNADMKVVQQDLILLNHYISRELETIIGDLNTINKVMALELKNAAISSYEDSVGIINSFCIVALILVLVFAVLLIFYAVKLNRSELSLLNENERAINIARQKMDLLQHMSHEIRNPISNIQGFLHIFGQTELSAKQSDMLSSISLSSGILLNTVNDVLAAAKMENSEFKLSNEPFNPCFVLKQTIETMRFSAEKKNLNLDYEFTGDKEAILYGDQFRLEQVMINLISNAIKYTNTGSIHVKAALQAKEDKQMLQVAITDTGVGIAAAEQTNLFSKYYQTSSATGKTGTGLGLYICKRFIELQGGTIKVNSTEGKGSVFSFYVPYATGGVKENSVVSVVRNPVSLLNGISILAVDDNHFTLKFLKMMTINWNVKVFFAENGKIALDILYREPVSVVFTDIHMPEMDGFELLTAIRKLQSPLCNLPVIAMNGDLDRYDEKMLLKKGFSAVGNKPIVEAHMAELIVKVLKM